MDFHLNFFSWPKTFGWQPYPVYVNNLKEAGVRSYTVAVDTHARRIFAAFMIKYWKYPARHLQRSAQNDSISDGLKAALHRTQTGQIDYPTFMQEIADAGVHFYTADLLNRTVKYFGKPSIDYYEEAIPNV